MNERPAVAVVISDFKGQSSNTDQPPDGAMELQVNMLSIKRGQLTTRGGLKEVVLDTLE